MNPLPVLKVLYIFIRMKMILDLRLLLNIALRNTEARF